MFLLAMDQVMEERQEEGQPEDREGGGRKVRKRRD